MAITTADSFLDLLDKSKLLTSEKSAEARDAVGPSDDAKQLAKTLVQQELLTWWQAAQLLAGRSSFFLGKYKLIELLGRGGMGSVFFAEHTTMNRPVALKIISKQLKQDPASLERFFTEARAIAALDHPNIVHAYSVDNEGDRYYMVMEFVEGQDLQRMVEAEGPLDYERAADYIRQAADGLAHAHGRDMIHCDVKPANLLVNKQGVVKILDMGMARLVGRREEPTGEQDNGVLGTVDYLAPELAMQSPHVDHRVDIYSLGCTFYFVLTGHPPFPEGTLAERIVKHQTQEPSRITRERPGAPKTLASICRKMMAKDPADRFQSAAEVSGLLAAWRPPKRRLKRAVPLDAAGSEGATGDDLGPLDIKLDTGPANGGSGSGTRLRKAGALGNRRKLVLFGGLGLLGVLIALVAVISLLAVRGPGTPDQGTTQTSPGTAGAGPDRLGGRESSGSHQEEEEEDEFPTPQYVESWQPDDGTRPPDEKPPPEPPGPAVSAPEPPAEQPEPERPPAEKPPDEKPPAETPPAEKPPAEKPPDEKPPQQPKDPFREFPKVVELPELDEAAAPGSPFALAKIDSGPEVDWQLLLLGGENVLRSTRQLNRKFVLQRKPPEAASASWTIQIEDTPSSGDPTRTDVAGISRDKNTLMFQWARGADPTRANYVCNCVLQVRVAGQSRCLPLVKPKQVEPLVVDLYQSTTKTTIPLDWLPDAGKLRVEISRVEGRKGHTLDPPEPSPPKTPIGLSFVRKDRHGNEPDKVAFRFTCTARRTGLNVELKLLEPPATRFKQIPLEGTEAVREMIVKAQEQKTKESKNARGGDRTRLSQELDFLGYQLWYLDFFNEVHQKAKIHFRVYLEAGDQQVVLATTQPN